MALSKQLEKALRKRYGSSKEFTVGDINAMKKKLSGTIIPTYAKNGGMINKKKSKKKLKGK